MSDAILHNVLMGCFASLCWTLSFHHQGQDQGAMQKARDQIDFPYKRFNDACP
jgi:hypothetical protein